MRFNLGARAALLLISLAACAPGYTLDVLEPGFSGIRITRMRGNILSSGGLFSTGELELNLERVDHPELPTAFAVLVEHTGDGVPLDRREPLVLVADGDTFRLAVDTLAGAWVRNDRERIDQARYPILPDTLRRFAAAREARVAVRVGPWTERRRLSEGAAAQLRRFVDEHLKPESIRATPLPPRQREGGNQRR